MHNEDLNLLFKALSQILSNQQEIEKQINILNKKDYYYDDYYSNSYTKRLAEKCLLVSKKFEERD